MREIKFRGKRKNGTEWIIGNLMQIDGEVFVFPIRETNLLNSPDWFEVDPNTIGQFTGLTDKNGKEVYEGDIVLRQSGMSTLIPESEHGLGEGVTVYKKDEPQKMIVYNKGYAFYLGTIDCDTYCGVLNNALHNMANQIEVIGDIHTNPELLKP